MKRSIYIFSHGELKRKGDTLCLVTEEGKKYLPVENTREILVFSELTLNKRLLEFLTENEIIIHFFNHYGYYIGSFYPREHLNSGYMLLKQVEHYINQEKRLILARKFVIGAIENIIKVLSYYQNRGKDLQEYINKIKELSKAIFDANSTEELMAIEGNIRNHYYSAFDRILNNEHFVFEERSRRPPKNRLNALISFANSLVYTSCLTAIYQTHLDPRVGYLHATNFRRFTLNLDVAEIFKPIIADRAIFNLINKGIIKSQHFEKKLDGIVLNNKGKQIVVEEMENRFQTTIEHRKLKRRVSYRELIKLELYKIQKHLMGEEEYKPFIAYW